MKKSLKLTLFLFLMVFSLNVHSQSSEVKKLQDKIEEWKKYDFISHVINSDEQTIYSRYNNTGIISGVYSKWSSYSNSRRYEYIITPQSANGNYGATVTRSITISTPYTKEGFELYKKSKIENVFKQIDGQLELEKKQKEDRNATAQKNAERKRKRGDYVKNKIELIENKKDSILIEIDRQKTEIKSRLDYHYTMIKSVPTWTMNFHEGDTILYHNKWGEVVSEETNYKPRKIKFSYGIDNSLLSSFSKGPPFKTFYSLELLKKQLSSLEKNIDKFSKYLDSNSKSFDEVKDEWDDRTEEEVVSIARKRINHSYVGTPYSSCNYCRNNGLSDDIFNERLLRSYNYEIYKAKKEGYDYVYSPLVWNEQGIENLTNELEKELNRFYENQNYIDSEGTTDLFIQDVNLSQFYIEKAIMASKFLVWYQKVFPSGSRTYSGSKVRKFIKCTSRFNYENQVSTLIDTWIRLREGFVKVNDDMIFSFINETENLWAEERYAYIDYNKLNQCLEELY